jgi:hypothetical protein
MFTKKADKDTPLHETGQSALNSLKSPGWAAGAERCSGRECAWQRQEQPQE